MIGRSVAKLSLFAVGAVAFTAFVGPVDGPSFIFGLCVGLVCGWIDEVTR